MVKIKKQSMPDKKAPANKKGLQPENSGRKRVGRPKEIHYALEKKFTLMLPRDVHKGLKIKSAELEVPMTTMIIDAIKKIYNI